MPVRVNRYLASTGLGSRRAVEELVRAGRVTVNGSVADLATQVEEGDDVRVDGAPVRSEPIAAVLLHKPAGVVTTARDPQGRATVVGLVESPTRLFPVGRLDRDTTGALLLTNDGALAERLAHPRHGVEKTYRARVRGDPSEEALEALRGGIELDDGPTAPARVRRIGAGVLELTIHEGRNRQVRRMCAAAGHPVIELHRSRYAGLTADDLAPGRWRRLTAAELQALRRA
ncbi:MAG TPA: pseudouridine synthase [Gaiellales bacterium]|nr:pseudouridine synthase [Gaiellales bacterium]